MGPVPCLSTHWGQLLVFEQSFAGILEHHVGGMAAVIFGFSFPGLPFVLLMPLCLVAGALGGASISAFANT